MGDMLHYTICVLILSFLLVSYSLFLLKRPGVHLLTIGFLQGLGFSLCYPLILLIYFGSDYNGKRVVDVLSFRGICWSFFCVFLLFAGKELAVFSTKICNENTVLTLLKRAKGYDFSSTVNVFYLFAFVYLCLYYIWNDFQVHKDIFHYGWFSPIFISCIFFISIFFLLNSFFCEKRNKLSMLLNFLIAFVYFASLPQHKTFSFGIFIKIIFPVFLLIFIKNLNIKHFILFLLISVVISFFCSWQRSLTQNGRSGFQRLALQPTATMLCLKQSDKPKQGLFWVKRMFARLQPNAKDHDKISFGTFCAYAFYNGEKDFEALKNKKKWPWSFSVNFLGEADLFFGYNGLFFILVLGFCLGALDAWFGHHRQFLLIYFFMSIDLCFGSLTSSSFLSSCIKSGILPMLLVILCESIKLKHKHSPIQNTEMF